MIESGFAGRDHADLAESMLPLFWGLGELRFVVDDVV